MDRLTKSKAAFEIFLVITTMFFAGSLNVNAQADSASSSGNACCELTKSGDGCVYTSTSNCNVQFAYADKECSETQFCETGCCFNNDGTCASMASSSVCASKGGVFSKGTGCDAIPLCGKVCCKVGNNYFMATKQQCTKMSELFPTLKSDFNPNINNEYECAASMQSNEMGCCLQETECTYTDRGSCIGDSDSGSGTSPRSTTGRDATGFAVVPLEGPLGTSGQEDNLVTRSAVQTYASTIFESGKYCSSIKVCGCKAKHHKDCYDGDVYWFDSCNNREEKSGDCDASKGTLCNKNTLKCESLDCKTTFDKKAIDGTDIVTYDGIPRKNGESWCEYDGAVGFGQDLVGSRHYRNLCIAGEEFIEPCKDYREELCVQGNVILPDKQKILTAVCKPNKWTECTTECNTAKDKTGGQKKLAMQRDKECCQDPRKSCFWSSSSPEDIKKINADNEASIRSLCADAVDPDTGKITQDNPNYEMCTGQSQQVAENNDGTCIPLVPPGLKFWNDEDNEESDNKQSTADAKKTCDVGNTECTTFFYKNMNTNWEWKSVDSTEACLKSKYAVGSAAVCRSLGDCGVHYNIAGKFSDLAYKCETSDGSCKGNKHGKSYNLIDIDWEKEIGSFDSFSKAIPLIVDDIDSGDYKGFNLLGGSAQSWALIAVAIFIAVVAIKVFIILSIAFTSIPVIGWIIEVVLLLIIAVIIIVSLIGADTDELTFNEYCQPWQAPYGSEDCEKCTNKEIWDGIKYDTCSEYKCKSLGQNCKWIEENEGSSRPSCVAINIDDVTWPIITPWPEALSQGYSLTEFVGGYEITPAIEGYGMISFGIMTDEVAQCRYALEPSIRYNDMTLDFGDVYFSKDHKLTLTALPNKINEIYVKCKDANGIDNTADYMIKFTSKGGKDLMPPLILDTSIKDGALVNGGAVLLGLKISEPGTCKYSSQNIAYDQMENNLVCTSFLEELPNSPAAKFKCDGYLKVNEGTNQYYFRCKDSAGNVNQESFMLTLLGENNADVIGNETSGIIDENETLQMEDDNIEPELTFVYKSNNILTISMDEPTTCEYSTNDFIYGSGIRMEGTGMDHTMEIERSKYYVVCADAAENIGQGFFIYP